DQRTAEMRSWADDIDVKVLEKSLPNRRKSRFSPDNQAEVVYRSAVEREEKGRLSEARKKWEELATLEDKECNELAAYHLLAQRHARAVDEALRKEPEIEQSAKQLSEAEKDIEPKDELERVASDAFRYQQLGDIGMAQRRWNELERRADKGSSWFLLAQKRKLDLREETFEDEERAPLVKKKLDQAKALIDQEPRNAKALLKEIVTL